MQNNFVKKFLKLSGLLSVSLQFILQACNPADKKFTCCQTSGFPKMRTFGFPKWFSQQAIFLLLPSFTILWVTEFVAGVALVQKNLRTVTAFLPEDGDRVKPAASCPLRAAWTLLG